MLNQYKMFNPNKSFYSFIFIVLLFVSLINFFEDDTIEISNGAHISLIGGNLGSRMMNYGHFETEMYVRYPEKSLIIRNMCDGGDTPGFRPHASRNLPWAFPGAEKFQSEFAKKSDSEGHFDSPDKWLTNLKTDIIIAFFGFSESFDGKENLENYKNELDAFIKHTLGQKYNGVSAPQLVIVSPTAYQDVTHLMDVPKGDSQNENIWLYTQAMKEVADKNNVSFVDAFTPSKKWYAETDKPLTIDGMQLNGDGYKKLAVYLSDEIFGSVPKKAEANRALIHDMVMEKNWLWHNDYKIPNGVHVYGRRYDPFGPDNYPAELEKIRQMLTIRDKAIWLAAQKGEKTNV
ncbi:MAG: SGNH/GDSL hydrolase family protein, partial [Saprospiraceae bacterium]|nr:SGNH/GDSL hydrolase family protein [Saprospiraceae bacterium]